MSGTLRKICFKNSPSLKSSRLYSLQPIGIGTPAIESLTGYLSRLAKAHCVTVGTLIYREISPLLKKKYLNHNRSRKIQSGTMLEVTKILDGTGQTAFEWAQVLETLTLLPPLYCLTMLPFKEIFSTKNLLRDRRAWCPLCYESSRANQEVVYEPLLWRLKAVTFCPTHNFPLQSSCSNCERSNLPILASAFQAGCCPHCKQWLGHFDNEKFVSLNEQFNIFTSKVICEALQLNFHSVSVKCKQNIIASIEKCLKYYADGSISKFARLTNVSARIIYNWRKGTNLFRLDLLAQVCWATKISLKNFLEGNLIMMDRCLKTNLVKFSKRTQGKNTFNLSLLRKLLEDAIYNKSTAISINQLSKSSGHDSNCFKRNFPELCNLLTEKFNSYKEIERKTLFQKMKSALTESPPPSVLSLSRRLNRCPATLYNLFPKICYEVAERKKAHKCATRKKNHLAIVEEVKNIAFSLCSQGIRPSQKSVAQLMNKPGQMSNEPARTALREICEKLSKDI